jgi:hypothetical protein
MLTNEKAYWNYAAAGYNISELYGQCSAVHGIVFRVK